MQPQELSLCKKYGGVRMYVHECGYTSTSCKFDSLESAVRFVSMYYRHCWN
eukprot:m.87653 g.87653  ORF g.87653 m.87653 type:complete len:51 (-) comp26103_c0_seq1:135-287(-)